MKEKVKDLDQVLQFLIMRNEGNNPVHMKDMAQPYLDRIDWSKCENEERLKYAEFKYKKGDQLYEDSDKHIVTLTGDGIRAAFMGADIGHCIYARITGSNKGCSHIMVYYGGGKFAEVISRPDEKEETQEPEFQPGEMVEHPLYDLDNKEKINKWKPCRFTGGYSESGDPIVESDYGIYAVTKIRKIQPDPEKEIKAKVKILIEENFRRKDGPETTLQIVSFERGRLESMLIEAFKTEVK